MVVGGGAAGLSAAVALSRARRRVLVVDGGQPRNAPAAGVHNFLTREGVSPRELVALGRDEVTRYGGEVVLGDVTGAEQLSDNGSGPSFAIATDGRAPVIARRLVVATGLVDELPDVPGLRERWGRDVVHCPYCHGYEVRDEPVGVIGTTVMSVHQALMWRQWCEDVVLFVHTSDEPTDEQLEQLAARGVAVVRGEVTGLRVEDDAITGIRLADGDVVTRRAVVVGAPVHPRAGVLESLGVHPVELEVRGVRMGTRIEADPMGQTAVRGVYVAGNVTEPMAQVVGAAAQGLMVAAAVNADLIEADVAHAVEERRAGHGHQHGGGHGEVDVAEMFEQPWWEERYGADEAVWSGRVNPRLAQHAADLVPGTALDVGCGEGADTIWLAQRGWHVTALDFSAAGIARARAHAEAAGVADRITWVQADVRTWTPPSAAFDLVSSQFMHQAPAVRGPLFDRLADAVRPGGTLLVVGHHPLDLQTGLRTPGPRHAMLEMMFTAGEVADGLDAERWSVEVAEAAGRVVTGPDGRAIVAHDAVLRARRRI
ncbi:NAD(P)/FAD-dependent oxidoreductase [Angustibacter aerolatus]